MSFYLSKILWLIINPFNIFIFFIFFGFISHFFLRNIFYKLSFFIAMLFFVITALMPTGKYMFYQLEKKFHSKILLPKKIDGILILSGATNPLLTKEFDQINLNGSIERLTESIQLLKKYPTAKIIFSGGSGSLQNPDLTHAYVAKKFYIQQQIDVNKIIFESKSRNTFENIFFSKEIANPKPTENWILITTAFHMTRALNIGEKLNWQFIPYAVDFQLSKKFSWKPTLNFLNNILLMQSASHEWVGLIAYYFMGRTNKIY